MFPAAFTLTSIVFFMLPVYLAVHAARQPVVKYFHGDWYYVLVVIPVIILIVHHFHMRNGPHRSITNLAVIVPSFLLLVYGTTSYTSASSKADRLFSTDCTTMSEKSHLQHEWEAAHLLYQTCLRSTAASRNLTTAYLGKTFRIQDCTEYQSAFQEHSRDWGYLQYLEQDHACTGFCIPGTQLWSKGPHQDSCAITVASVFRYIVKGNSLQVITISLITVCLEMAAVLFLGPVMSFFGADF